MITMMIYEFCIVYIYYCSQLLRDRFPKSITHGKASIPVISLPSGPYSVSIPSSKKFTELPSANEQPHPARYQPATRLQQVLPQQHVLYVNLQYSFLSMKFNRLFTKLSSWFYVVSFFFVPQFHHFLTS